MNVAKPSEGAQPWFSIRESTLGMKHTYVMNVERRSGTDPSLCATRESTL